MIQKTTYSDQIREYIKTCILNGEYGPGDKVNEADIAARLKVSRAPVREALQHLTESGILVSVPQKGKFIASLTAGEIYESYHTGGILEGAAVASTIHLFTPEDFAQLAALVAEMARQAEQGEGMGAIAATDTAFHEIMFSRCGNTLLRVLSRRCCQGISKFLLYRHWSGAFSPEEMPGRHKRLLDAAQSGDAWRIENAFREHYQESGRRMAQYGSDVTATDSRTP